MELVHASSAILTKNFENQLKNQTVEIIKSDFWYLGLSLV